MNDESARADAPPDPAPQTSAPLTAGGLIRQARETRGLHIAALAVSLKVPVKKLEALEADRLDAWHDAVFVRALASSVCRTLRIDPLPVLEKLPQGAAPVLQPEAGINAPFQSSGNVKGVPLGARMGRPAVLAVAALLVAAAVVGFLPELKEGIDGSWSARPGAANPARSQAPPPTGTLAPQSPDVAAAGAAPNAPADGVLENVELRPAEVAGAAPAPASSALGVNRAALAPATMPVPASEPSLVAANAILLFKARATTWVEVTDAKGLVVLRRTLSAGESAATSGTPPLQSVVGRADAVEVQVRGKPFDLLAVSKENVARFEVK